MPEKNDDDVVEKMGIWFVRICMSGVLLAAIMLVMWLLKWLATALF